MAFADPALALQKAINQHLRATTSVVALVSTYNGGPAIFDQAPAGAALPYISTGPMQVLPEHGDCLDGGETIIQIDGWAGNNIPGIAAPVRARQLGAAIASALDEAELVLDGQRCVYLMIEQTQYLREPDGITTHAAVSVRALTDPL